MPLSARDYARLLTRAMYSCYKSGRNIITTLESIYQEHQIPFQLNCFVDKGCFKLIVHHPVDGKVSFKIVSAKMAKYYVQCFNFCNPFHTYGDDSTG